MLCLFILSQDFSTLTPFFSVHALYICAINASGVKRITENAATAIFIPQFFLKIPLYTYTSGTAQVTAILKILCLVGG
jgi:hypothetical protein